MIYISIDTETTGIDKEKCQVIELGAIIEDTTKPLSFEESPKFECIVECLIIQVQLLLLI